MRGGDRWLIRDEDQSRFQSAWGGFTFAFGSGGDVGPGISERMVAVARMMKTCRVS